MFAQERLPNDITSLRIAEVSSIAVESLRKCQFQRLRAKVKHNVGFAIKLNIVGVEKMLSLGMASLFGSCFLTSV